MKIALALAVGIPACVGVANFIGTRLYGEKWYRILGASAIDEELAKEIEQARITKLNSSNYASHL